jgi:hypothetical protein
MAFFEGVVNQGLTQVSGFNFKKKVKKGEKEY